VNRLIAVMTLLWSLFSVSPAALVQSAPSCQFVLGFAILHDAIPSTVGNCIDDEGHNPANGDGLQHTVAGLLVWRKADNFTAFTDGYHSWVNGPGGVGERLNQQRFSWEANPDNLPIVATATATVLATSDLSSSNVTVVNTGSGSQPIRGSKTGGGIASASSAGAATNPDPANVAGHTFYASSHSSATLIYCDDDSLWKGLSPKYLKHFGSWGEAHAAFLDRKLHQPC